MRNPKKYFKGKPISKYSDKKKRQEKEKLLKSLKFDLKWQEFINKYEQKLNQS